ncbi:MAG: hypothetical protein Q9187_007187 [Circinaria calcarea]
MDKTTAWAFLQSTWAGIEADRLICCHCGHRIESAQVLARTFTIESRGISNRKPCAEKILVPRLSDAMIVYHRHLSCLFQSTRYIAISHVWHPLVADLQYKKSAATSSIDLVEQIVRELPVRIAQSLTSSLPGDLEIWHDYISVPQWITELKGQIILSIPEIFGKAFTTVAYLADINTKDVRSMREGSSAQERCRGISNLCNSRWFSRVWTAMELTQSCRLRAMLQDFSLVADDTNYQSFLKEIEARWTAENEKFGVSHTAEEIVKMGDNLVPCQLGPLWSARDLNLNGIRIPFGTAHELLARRCITNHRDFFHAMLGLLKSNLTEAQLSRDTNEAIQHVAINCLKEGDFTPLFMVPASAQKVFPKAEVKKFGYLDIRTFALGDVQAQPTFPAVKFLSIYPTIQAKCLGTIQFIKQVKWLQEGAVNSLAILTKLTFEYTGLDAREFATTLCVRLYSQREDRVFQHLSKENRMRTLYEQLKRLHNASLKDSNSIATEICATLGLCDRSLGGGHGGSVFPPPEYLDGHGSTIHLSQYRAIAGITCLSCYKTFLILIAPFRPASELKGAMAYRVPGLKFSYSTAGSAGFILKEQRMSGRFLWGLPTCQCPKIQEVEVALEDLPVPQPNNFQYGNKAGKIPGKQ